MDSTEAHLWLRGTLAVLACWRVTHLLAREDGPGNLLVATRRRLGNGFLGQLMDCFYCLSLWVAAPLAWLVFPPGPDLFLGWLALSGGACLLFRLSPEPVVIHSLPNPDPHPPTQEGI